jgi:hypothetical protein
MPLLRIEVAFQLRVLVGVVAHFFFPIKKSHDEKKPPVKS